jgi:hypothetical protein
VAVSEGGHAIPVFFFGRLCLNDLHSYEKSIRYLLKEVVPAVESVFLSMLLYVPRDFVVRITD